MELQSRSLAWLVKWNLHLMMFETDVSDPGMERFTWLAHVSDTWDTAD